MLLKKTSAKFTITQVTESFFLNCILNLAFKQRSCIIKHHGKEISFRVRTGPNSQASCDEPRSPVYIALQLACPAPQMPCQSYNLFHIIYFQLISCRHKALTIQQNWFSWLWLWLCKLKGRPKSIKFLRDKHPTYDGPTLLKSSFY